MAISQTEENRIIRDAGFARRLEQACDASPHCPAPNHGRLTWLADEIGKKLGSKISVQTVARWMNGEAKPRQDKNIKLAQILGVDSIWLYLGVEQDIPARERKARNATADGAVNLVAGLIEMDGGRPAFPEVSDARAHRDHVDVYAVIRGVNYAIHVSMGTQAGADWSFNVPANREAIVVLGVVREGFSFRIVEISQELIEEHGEPSSTGRAIVVTLDNATIDAAKLSSFANRL